MVKLVRKHSGGEPGKSFALFCSVKIVIFKRYFVWAAHQSRIVKATDTGFPVFSQTTASQNGWVDKYLCLIIAWPVKGDIKGSVAQIDNSLRNTNLDSSKGETLGSLAEISQLFDMAKIGWITKIDWAGDLSKISFVVENGESLGFDRNSY